MPDTRLVDDDVNVPGVPREISFAFTTRPPDTPISSVTSPVVPPPDIPLPAVTDEISPVSVVKNPPAIDPADITLPFVSTEKIGINVDDPYVPDTTPVVFKESVPAAPNTLDDPLIDISPDVPDRSYVVIA